MKKKPINPYTSLLDDIKSFCRKLKLKRRIEMWYYPKERLNETWTLADLNQRVAAGKQLGFNVELTSDDKGLHVHYISEQPTIPWQFE